MRLEFLAFWGGGEAAQDRDGNYQDEYEEAQQSQLKHAGSKYGGTLGGPGSPFCECGGFQGNHQDAPNAGDQTHYEKWFRNQEMRVDGNADSMHDLDEHEDNEQLIQHKKRLGGNGPMSEAIPEDFAGGGDGPERGYKKQHGQNGIDEHFGLAQKVVKADAKLVFGHIGLLAETVRFGSVHGQSIAISSFAGKREGG